ncbi:hypothetical protein BDN72DRAFT_863684 [Pluteus cervinus]|uniref:Uncharacterized protein n=1 Tax=Pluteus cervinus TaxID=181527 RepID=A0ACD3A710_9AGAR|nr:hypothetical protein BDN72DRAFT_863684 [Pluteus cervinus]
MGSTTSSGSIVTVVSSSGSSPCFSVEYSCYLRISSEVAIYLRYDHPPFVRDISAALRRDAIDANPSVVQITDVDTHVEKYDPSRIVPTYFSDWWNTSAAEMLPKGLISVNLNDTEILEQHFAQTENPNLSRKRKVGDTLASGAARHDSQGRQAVAPLNRQNIASTNSQDIEPPKKRVKQGNAKASGSRKRTQVVNPPLEMNINQMMEIVVDLPMSPLFGSDFDENSSADIGERAWTDDE